MCATERQERYDEEMLFELTTSDVFNDTKEIASDGNKGREVKLFSFVIILTATNNFSPENKLGEGGFGPVYKVKTLRQHMLFVKKSYRNMEFWLNDY